MSQKMTWKWTEKCFNNGVRHLRSIIKVSRMTLPCQPEHIPCNRWPRNPTDCPMHVDNVSCPHVNRVETSRTNSMGLHVPQLLAHPGRALSHADRALQQVITQVGCRSAVAKLVN